MRDRPWFSGSGLIGGKKPLRAEPICNHKSARAEEAALRAEGQARDFPVSSRRAVAARDVRLQAGAGEIQRQTLPAGIAERADSGVYQGGRGAVRYRIQIRQTRAVRRGDVRGLDAFAQSR